MTPVMNSSLLQDLAIEIDLYGSAASVLQGAEWFVCFVHSLRKQRWHRSANPKHQHVFAIRMMNEDCWPLVEPWWTRMLWRVGGHERI